MREAAEAVTPVVAAHAAVSNAAEGHPARRQVDDGVVDAPAAERQRVQHAALHGAVFREQVARQRMRPCGGEGNRFVEAADGQNRQNRPEDFLLHDRAVRRNIAEDGRRNAQGGGVNTAAVDDLPRCHQPGQAVEMLLVDDVDVLRAVQRVRAELVELLLQRRNESVFDFARHQHIIRRDARLPGVEQLAERNPSRGERQVSIFRDNHWAFAAQFQRCGGQMLRRAAKHLLPDVTASSEENLVERLVKQCLILHAPTLDNGNFLQWEAFGADLPDDGRSRGRILRRLQDAAIAARQRAKQRFDGQQKWVIPRGHDEHDAHRVVADETARRELRQRRENVRITAVAARPAEQVAQFRQHHAGFAHVRFCPALAEVALQGSFNILLMCQNRAAQAAELIEPMGYRARYAGRKAGFLRGEQRGNIRVGRIGCHDGAEDVLQGEAVQQRVLRGNPRDGRNIPMIQRREGQTIPRMEHEVAHPCCQRSRAVRIHAAQPRADCHVGQRLSPRAFGLRNHRRKQQRERLVRRKLLPCGQGIQQRGQHRIMRHGEGFRGIQRRGVQRATARQIGGEAFAFRHGSIVADGNQLSGQRTKGVFRLLTLFTRQKAARTRADGVRNCPNPCAEQRFARLKRQHRVIHQHIAAGMRPERKAA